MMGFIVNLALEYILSGLVDRFLSKAITELPLHRAAREIVQTMVGHGQLTYCLQY